jgi:hypothetical protein
MQHWESVLRRDTKAWDSFKNWIEGLRLDALAGLMNADNVDRARGVVEGIARVQLAATANEREEISRARAG